MYRVVCVRPQNIIGHSLAFCLEQGRKCHWTHVYVFYIFKKPIHHLYLAVVRGEGSPTSTDKLFQWLISLFHVKIILSAYPPPPVLTLRQQSLWRAAVSDKRTLSRMHSWAGMGEVNQALPAAQPPDTAPLLTMLFLQGKLTGPLLGRI